MNSPDPSEFAKSMKDTTIDITLHARCNTFVLIGRSAGDPLVDIVFQARHLATCSLALVLGVPILE